MTDLYPYLTGWIVSYADQTDILVIKCYFQSEILYKDLSVYQDDITNFIIGLKHSQVYYAIDLIFIYLVSKTELNLDQFKTLTRFYVKLITSHTVCWKLDTAIKITSPVSQKYCHSCNFFLFQDKYIQLLHEVGNRAQEVNFFFLANSQNLKCWPGNLGAKKNAFCYWLNSPFRVVSILVIHL